MDDKYIKHDFVSCCYLTADDNNFDVKKYFSGYPRCEEYNDQKNYECSKFFITYDEKTGEKEYKNTLYKVTINDNISRYYVVTTEILSNEDKEILKKYCVCEYCNKHWLNPIKYITCKCCAGCMDSYDPSQYTIKKARENMNKK